MAEMGYDDFIEDDLPAEDMPPDSGPPPDELPPAELAKLREQAQAYQSFMTDPAFAREVVQRRAQQLGLQVGTPPAQQPAAPETQDPPADYVQRVAQGLAPELQFMAPQIAKATWLATQATIAPLRQEQDSLRQQAQQQTYEQMARQLESEHPGWQQYEDTMLDLLGFLRTALTQQGPMTHPKHGSALQLLYRLASGDAHATAQAGRRMQQALRNGTSTSRGVGERAAGVDVQTLIAKAPTSQSKWQLAMRHALREHGVGDAA